MLHRLFDILEKQKEEFQLSDALAGKENGQWRKYSSAEFYEKAELIGYGLLALGLKKEDKIAIISNNRPEWNIVDMGMQQIGVSSVPIYPTLSDSEFAFILKDCGAKIIIVSDENLYKRISGIKPEVTSLQEVYTFDKVTRAKNYYEILEAGQKNKNEKLLHECRVSVNPDDVVTLIYTSGTTGNPKGVMLTHANILSNVTACYDLPPVTKGTLALSFLPLCHVYERMLTYLYM